MFGMIDVASIAVIIGSFVVMALSIRSEMKVSVEAP